MYCAVTSYEFAVCCVLTLACFMQTTKGEGGSRAIPAIKAQTGSFHVRCGILGFKNMKHKLKVIIMMEYTIKVDISSCMFLKELSCYLF